MKSQIIVLCDSVVYCKDHSCTTHRNNLYKIDSSVIDLCVTSSQHIPNNSCYKSSKAMPGWNDQVQQLKEEALSWHAYWKAHGRPTSGYVAEMHRIIRAGYHIAIRHIEKKATKIQSEKMAQAILSNGSRGVWPEVRKNKGKTGKWHAVWMVVIIMMILLIYSQTNIWNCITLCHMMHLK